MRYSSYLILLIAVLVTTTGCALINPYIKALKKIEKGQFDQASFQLSNIKKDTCCSALEAYAWTLHYKNEGSPFQKLDSAIKWAHIGDTAWENSKNWEISYIERRSNNKKPFEILIREIDSLGFIEAKSKANEKAFIRYLENFSETPFEEKAIALRDSFAFQDAKRENTYLSYKKFIEKYPNSTQAEEAREIYELLLFETHTRDKHRISYENFIKKFPHSPYIKEAQEKLFELYTLDYNVSSFENFINAFPNSLKADEAKLWVRHISEQYDSINPVFVLPQKDKESYKLIKPNDTIFNMELDSIKNHYACEPYRNPYFIYSKSGKWGLANAKGQGLIPANFHNLEKLRNDIYVYSIGSKKGLVHVSGFRITNALYDDFQILNDTFLSVSLNEKYALASNNGKLLTSFDFQEIKNIGNELIALKKDRKWAIEHPSAYFTWPDIPKLEFNYDTVFRSNYGKLFIGNEEKLFLLNNDLDTLINYDFRLVNEARNYFQILNENTYSLYSKEAQLLAQSNSEIYSDETGYAYKLDSTWRCLFFNDTFEVNQFENYNSYYKKLFISDTIYIYHKNGRFSIENYEVLNAQIYKQNESDTFCFKVGIENKFGLIDANGETVLNLEWDDIKVIDENSIRVSKKGKYGLYHFKGKQILKSEYTAISNYDNGALTLFKENKFGLIHTRKDILIKPRYNSSLKLLDLKKPFFTIKDENGLKLYDLSNKEIAEAKDIVTVNDSLVLFNQDFSWKLMKLNENDEFDNLGISALRYRIWQDGMGNNHLIYETATGYGFYNVQKEENIYPEYFMIYPITDKHGEPFIFYTFKYYEEIDLYLLKILDYDGLELYKSLITSDQASKLSCDNLLGE